MQNRTGGDALRRDFLLTSASGLGALAFSSLLGRDGLMAADPATGHSNPLAVRGGHFPATAKQCIFIFLAGAPSQIDLAGGSRQEDENALPGSGRKMAAPHRQRTGMTGDRFRRHQSIPSKQRRKRQCPQAAGRSQQEVAS